MEECSSIGRAPVSKTGGWGFESLLACHPHPPPACRGRERNGRDVTMSGVIGFWDQSRTFLAQVRNELERVTWPSKKEVYATTFVVILTSVFFGMYLWGVDLLLNVLIGWVFAAFGVA